MSQALAQSTGEFSMVLSSTYNYTKLEQEDAVFTAGSLEDLEDIATVAM